MQLVVRDLPLRLSGDHQLLELRHLLGLGRERRLEAHDVHGLGLLVRVDGRHRLHEPGVCCRHGAKMKKQAALA